ncbi:MAG: succinate--CoA ligase subunit alpha [Candidatus Bathyarchaeota archaeon]|nr:succinate--CoA ligase subunit alpha [Candidatus Bathyarchaeota archaeon]
MGILVDSNTRVLVQGITGNQGSFHTKLMLEYGTKIVAGTSPSKGGSVIFGVPVYNTVNEACANHSLDASIIFVPSIYALDAALEALESGIKIIVIITEAIPVRDTIELMACKKDAETVIIGPNTPGIINPGSCKLGILPSHVFKPGNVGVISRSGTLTYEIAGILSQNCIGQSSCLGLGGDIVTGLNFIEALELFREDNQTKAVVLIGEIGGNIEELAAAYVIKESYPKPIVAFVAGIFAPPEKRMGHAGAIIMGKTGTAGSKILAFEKAGISVAKKPSDVARLLREIL